MMTEAFTNRLNYIERGCKQFKASFTRVFKDDPCEALQCYGGDVARSQKNLDALLHVRDAYLTQVGKAYPTPKAAIEAAIPVLRQHALLVAAERQNKSGHYGPVCDSTVVGTLDAVRELEYLVNHPGADA